MYCLCGIEKSSSFLNCRCVNVFLILSYPFFPFRNVHDRSFDQVSKPYYQRCFVPSLVELGTMVQGTKIKCSISQMIALCVCIEEGGFWNSRMCCFICFNHCYFMFYPIFFGNDSTTCIFGTQFHKQIFTYISKYHSCLRHGLTNHSDAIQIKWYYIKCI